jgi:hypothetical protein
MLREYIDGIPLDLAATLLPGRSRFNLGLGSHVHAHARAQTRYADAGAAAAGKATSQKLSPLKQAALLDSLQRTVRGLTWEPSGTEWAEYADHTSYGDDAAKRKDALVERFLAAAGGHVVWDVGANTGRFSRIAAGLGRRVIAWDIDPAATERHYQAIRRDRVTSVLPLLVDLANPSPALGWAHAERRSLLDRADADVVLALALVHHLAISRNRVSSSSSSPRATRWWTSCWRRARTSSPTPPPTDSGRRSAAASRSTRRPRSKGSAACCSGCRGADGWTAADRGSSRRRARGAPSTYGSNRTG